MGCRGGKCCPWAILTVASHRPGRLDVAKDMVQLPQPTPCRLLTGQFGAENLHCSLLPPSTVTSFPGLGLPFPWHGGALLLKHLC